MSSSSRRPVVRFGLAAVAVLVAGSLVACGGDDDSAETTSTTSAEQGSDTSEVAEELTIEGQWVRPVADLTAMNRTAAYMEITGGSEDDALIAASVDPGIATTVEVHETVAAGDDAMGDDAMGDDAMGDDSMDTTVPAEGDDHGDGGMMTMREVERIEIPAGTTVTLEPGGYHVMMMDVQRTLSPGDTIEITLTFERAGEVVVTAEVREP